MTDYPPETLAYTAGLLDGEGCISINKVQPSKATRRVTPGYELHISLTSTDKAIIAWLQETFGGSITDRSLHPSMLKTGWKPAHVWRLGNNKAGAFLVLMLPYLKIKQSQAALAIEFLDYKKAHPLYARDNQRLQSILDREETYYQHLNSQHASRKEWIPGNLPVSPPVNPSPLTPVTLAYTSGLFDGEGCIRISKRSPTEQRGKGHLRQASYSLRVKVANTDKSIIEWLCATFPGGHMQETSSEQSRARTGYSQAWEWGLSSQKADAFLALIVLYLKTKRQQAILAREFQAYHLATSRYVQGTRTQETIDRQEAYRQQVNGLNAKRANA